MITYTCILVYKGIAINKNIIFKTNQKNITTKCG